MSDASKNINGPRDWKRPVLIGLCIFLSIVLVLLIAFVVIYESTLGRLDRIDPDQESTMSWEEASRWEEENRDDEDYDPSLEEIDPSDITWGDEEDDFWGEEDETGATEDTEETETLLR